MAVPEQGPNEFEVARQRANQQNTALVQGQKDALKRRFAAMGSVNSGAAIKQDQLADEAGAQRLESVNQGINAAEFGEKRRLREVQEGRDFARGEREASQGFAAQQAELGRGFQSGEAEKGRLFAGGEADKGREFASTERRYAQRFTSAENERAQAIQASQFGKQMDFANAQFDEEKFINRENIRFAEAAFAQRDFLDKLLDPKGTVSDIPIIGGLADSIFKGADKEAQNALGSVFKF